MATHTRNLSKRRREESKDKGQHDIHQLFDKVRGRLCSVKEKIDSTVEETLFNMIDRICEEEEQHVDTSVAEVVEKMIDTICSNELFPLQLSLDSGLG